MTAYDDCLSVEAKGQKIIYDWLIQRGCVVVFNVNDVRGAEFQSFGDLIVVRPDNDKHELIELKIEEHNAHGNLFVETWSNKNWWNPGWIYKSKAEWLFYYFLQEDTLYQISMNNLRRFVFRTNESGKVETFSRYKERPQRKYNQPNQTCGLCVPIADLQKNAGLVTLSTPCADILAAA